MSHKSSKMGGPIGPRKSRKVPEGLASRIVAKRLRLGLSQEKAAEALGVARESIARWEMGQEPRGLYLTAVLAWLAKGGR